MLLELYFRDFKISCCHSIIVQHVVTVVFSLLLGVMLQLCVCRERIYHYICGLIISEV